MMAFKGSGIRIIVLDGQQKLISSLRSAVSEPIESFTETADCISFLEQESNDNTFIIAMTIIDETALQTIDSISSVEAILILTTVTVNIDTYPRKVVGVYPQIEIFIRSFWETFDIIEEQLNFNSLLFYHHQDGTSDPAFFFYEIWKNHNKSQTSTKNSFAEQARLFYESNNHMKMMINDFESTYKSTNPLVWLDNHRHPFPYRLFILNALRTHNLEALSYVDFFITDIRKQMKPVTTSNTSGVYIGTKLSRSFIQQIEQQSTKDIIAFQCFLTVTRSRANALATATRPSLRQNTENVLFKIDLKNTLCATVGETLIIDLATPFHITCVTRSNASSGQQQQLTVIKMVAIEKSEAQSLFENYLKMQQELGKNSHELLYQMSYKISDHEAKAIEYTLLGEYQQAVSAYAAISEPNARVLNAHGRLLHEHLGDLLNALECHKRALTRAQGNDKVETFVLLGTVHNGLKQHDEAHKYLSEAVKLLENEKKKNPSMLAKCLLGMGTVHWAREELDDALSYVERSLAIREQEVKPKNDFDIAACLGNMGSILYHKGDINRALQCATRAVELLRQCTNGDPRLAAALNNLGALHQANGDFVKARQHFEEALACLHDTTHPYRTSTANNIARLNLLEHSKE
ncbi:unnamed protein product [Rotaria sp. Silwood1]|nr:unnamed protein product [Rotaria sp. Silwood1]